MENERRQRLFRVALWSLTRPRNLVLLILSLLLAPELPPLALIGILIFGTLVWHDVHDPELAETILPPQEDAAAPEVAVLAAYREQVGAAEATRRRIRAAVDGADRSLARVLAPIKAQVDQVTDRLLVLVQRAPRIEQFLARENRENIEESMAALEGEIAASSDEFAREQYAQARAAREEQLRNHDELSLCLARVRAQLANVLSSLDAAEGKVMALQAADLRHADLVGDTVTRSLQALSQEMTGFQESIDATIALRAR